MSDYLAEVREYMAGRSEVVLASIAESLHTIASALTPPQDATTDPSLVESLPPSAASRPAEPCALACSCGECHHSVPLEPSLVALDRAERQTEVLRALRLFLTIDHREYDTDDWQRALDRLRATGRALFALDEIGRAS